jgi:solute carrier family 25 citrate transporter 1
MEYIKTQLQLQSKAKGAQLPYTGMISGLKYTVRTTGFLSLYRGLAPTLVGSVPKAGIRFGLNSVFKEQMRGKDGKLNVAQNFLAGLGAGVSEALLVVAPVETVKTKCIELNMGFVPGFKYILKTEGFGGVYQGAFATALKQGSNQGLRFMWFNEYKRIVTKDGETKLTPIMGLFGGMTAGCFSTLGNNPFDVVKVSIQNFHGIVTNMYFERKRLNMSHTIIFRLVCKEQRRRSTRAHSIVSSKSLPRKDLVPFTQELYLEWVELFQDRALSL